MRAARSLSLLLVLFASVSVGVSALQCQSCSHDSCADIQGYITEECDPQVEFCYTLKNADGKVYRTGCAHTDCSRIQVVGRGECALCDRDNCNALRLPLDRPQSAERPPASSESKSSEEVEQPPVHPRTEEDEQKEAAAPAIAQPSAASLAFSSLSALLFAALISMSFVHVHGFFHCFS
ncbi:hypothetical protein M3Y99_01469600 [Aphelenchoides fujianensis]|nr:hypothetical protein M3Y99_01469600 [Aphelenchoides fujianensis]